MVTNLEILNVSKKYFTTILEYKEQSISLEFEWIDKIKHQMLNEVQNEMFIWYLFVYTFLGDEWHNVALNLV